MLLDVQAQRSHGNPSLRRQGVNHKPPHGEVVFPGSLPGIEQRKKVIAIQGADIASLPKVTS
jgi:hypothetical protein